MNLATIDIGTNTTLLLVAPSRRRAAPSRCSRSGRRSPGSAAGIGRERRAGRRGDRAHAGACCASSPRSRAGTARASPPIGTEALRRAPNAAAFLGPAAEILGTRGRGHRRRARGGADVSRGRRPRSRTCGRARSRSSTSAAARRRSCSRPSGEVGFRTSLPLGSVRLTEALRPPRPADRRRARRRSPAPIDAAIARRPVRATSPRRWSASPGR